MTTRLTWAAVLSIVLIPLLAVGLVDPLEGFPFLLVGLGLVAAVRLLSHVRIPKVAWIPAAIAVALMAVILALSFFAPRATDGVDQATNPTLLLGPVLLWSQRLVIIVMVAGLILYAVRVVTALRVARKG